MSPRSAALQALLGGIFVDEAYVVDGNMVSGRTWHDHGHVMREWMAMLRACRDGVRRVA